MRFTVELGSNVSDEFDFVSEGKKYNFWALSLLSAKHVKVTIRNLCFDQVVFC